MFLLESVEGGAQRGPLFDDRPRSRPHLALQRRHAEINRRALHRPDAFVPCPGKPLEALRALLAESRIELPPGLPPMSAGVFGYLGYDMVRQMERLAPAKPDPIGVPEAMLIRPTVMVVFDGVRDEMSVVTPVRPAPGVSAARGLRERAWRGSTRWSPRSKAPLDHAAPWPSIRSSWPARRVSNTTEAEFHRRWSPGRRTISPPATPSRSCCRSASRAASTCRLSRSIARCGGSIRRPISASSISAASRSSSPARKSWCACATAR